MPRLRSVDRKLSRATDARGVLVQTLATQLVMNGSLTTGRSRAKVVLPYSERLVSRAKRGDLAARRYVLARLDTTEAANRLVDVIAPQMKRDSGFVRFKAAPSRVGDDSPQATLSFVDEVKDIPVPPRPAKKKPLTKSKKATTKKPAATKVSAKATKDKKS